MSRLPELTSADIAPEYQAVWDRIAGTRKGVWGPYQVLMHVPPLAQCVAAVGEYIRFKSKLPGSERELAILAAAREAGSQYEWAIHEPFAHSEGTSDAAIEAVRSQGALDGLEERERLVVEIVRSLWRERSIGDDLYEKAIEILGREHTVEIVGILGFYNLLAFVLQGFAVPLPEGAEPGFPESGT